VVASTRTSTLGDAVATLFFAAKFLGGTLGGWLFLLALIILGILFHEKAAALARSLWPPPRIQRQNDKRTEERDKGRDRK
jgi:hypothetical protein